MTLTHITRHLAAVAALLLTAPIAQAGIDVDYEATVTVNAGSGDLAPYYVASNRGGTVTQQFSGLLSAAAWHNMDTTRRLSYGFGAEVWAGYSNSADYLRYDGGSGTMVTNAQHPARAWVQQAYIEGKYRGVQVILGQKHMASPWLHPTLSSGDLVMSGNARPPAGISAGFVNFQNIPFTRGWVQISGIYGYYKYGDGDWLTNHYNYYNDFITTSAWFNYKNIYFRTPPHKPFVLTLGAQAACQFGGTAAYYQRGVLQRTVEMPANAKAFFRAFIPGSGGTGEGDSFVEGNHVGSWDIIAQYTFRTGQRIRAYHQRLWEDGSGIGFQNGFDGLWGLEYSSTEIEWIDGIVVELLNLTQQSGPIHWAVNDHPDSPINTRSSGNDDYYNNYIYNGYQARGMSIGSPLVRSPLYNLDGYMRYAQNQMRAIHLGITGHISDEWQWRVLASRCSAWGTTGKPSATRLDSGSALFEAIYSPQRWQGLRLTAQLGYDRGELYGDTFGMLLSATYHGNLTFGK